MAQFFSLRRSIVFFLVLLAVGLVSSTIYVIFNEEPLYDPDELFDSGVIVNAEKQPRFVFPEELRTTDLSLNRFIDRFFRLCAQAKYPDIRLMISQQSSETLAPSRFESMFNIMKEARIKAIKKLPAIPNEPGPAYVLVAEYDLEPNAMKSQKSNNLVRLLIRKEEGEWRLGPVSREIVAKIEAHESATTKPASDTESSSRPANDDAPKFMANQPIKIEPEED
ncbi:MAG: hypothetical protein KF841_11810 [Phycisphaerae bacterium]|nr:hypothetical protein [Phycisphaerae bacterium]